MSDNHDIHIEPNQPISYEITIKGHLSSHWADWFEGMTITRQDNGNTLLVGPVVDQAALHGFLKKVRDLGLPLISVRQIPSDQPGNTQPIVP